MQVWRLEEYPQLLEQHHRDMMLYEADLATWKRKGRGAGEPLPERPDEPAAERYLVNDVTIEALAERLQDAPRGLLAANDELEAWLSSFDRYRSGRGGDVAKWLSIHRAEPLLVDRKTGPMKTIFIKRAAVSVTGSIPPHTLSRALGVQHIENGLAARLLLALPPRHGKRWTEATVDPQLTRRVEVLFGRLLALDFGTDANDTPAPIDLPLAPDGKAAWVEFYNEHAREQESTAGPLAAAYSKIEGYAARLALVVHLVRWACDDPTLGHPEAIDGQSIGVGVKLARWFVHEARRVYAVLGETDEERDQRELAELLRRKGGSVTPRDLMRSSRQYCTADEAEGALDSLAKAGYGDWRENDHGGGRGRPTRRFVLAGGADVDTNSAKPDEKRICVNVNGGDGAGDADPVNDLLAEASGEDSDEWGEL